jgi:hypothetical protein
MLAANDIVRKMFAYRHDVLKALMADGVKLVVLGRGERISDLPEYRKLSDRSAVDASARFLEYNPQMKLLAVGEENVLAEAGQARVGGSQVIRVMAQAVYEITAKRPVDPGVG